MNQIDKIVEILKSSSNNITIIIKNDDELLLATDVAKKWKCNPNYVRNLYYKGFLKGLKFSNKTIKFRKEEIEDFEIWAENKDLSNLEKVIDIRTGEKITQRI